jgi:Tol biopolymer transport system component/DNA-binding winged helix-turn-helix (wHTH) protein
MPADVLRLGDGVELDRGAYELRRSGRALKLERIPMEILLLLVERRGQLVSREDIIEKVWGKAVHLDTDNSINAAIRKIRQALKDDPEDPIFVQTVTGKGYRFIAPAGELAERVDEPVFEDTPQGNGNLGLREDTITLPGDIATAPPALQEPAGAPRVKPNFSVRLLLALVFCVVVALVVARLRPVARPPQVKQIRQITHAGLVINNENLIVTGSRIYFADSEKGDRQIEYLSLDGETVSPVEKPFPATALFDVLPSGNELLIGEVVLGLSSWRRAIWRLPIPAGAPRRVGNLFADDCTWSPDGHTIAYTNEAEQSLNVVDSDGGSLRKLASFAGVPFKPRWSPDGKLIRVSVYEAKGNGIALWQLDASGHNVKQMLRGWSGASRAWAGKWTGDGRYFLFTGFQGGQRNIWALREERDIFGRNSTQPVQLTDGPLDFYLPTPSVDGKTIYAVGTRLHGQLMRYNANSREFEPYLDGASAEHVTYSLDGKWMAYVTYPEGALIRSRLDGSERLRLTFPPMRAYDVRWSPDGSQIAFEGAANAGAAQKVYVVSANGGSSRLLTPSSSDRQVLSDWLPDGQSLLFGSLDGTAWALHTHNLKTGRETLLSGTLGMNMGRLSPDGRYLAALSASDGVLFLYDMVAGTTQRVAEYADYPSWSVDGKYVYYSTLSAGLVVGPEKTGIFRVKVGDSGVERVVPVPPFALGGGWGFWSGLTPDGSLLVLRELGTSDVYALDVDLP